jgi:metabolite-proton symporter
MTDITTAKAGAVSADRKEQSLTTIALATMAGSAIEAFDFLAYGTAAALVFNVVFFPAEDAALGTLAAFGAFAAGFFARPVGGIIFGHFGDRIGRKAMLTVSLMLMGVATVLIGLLPSYAAIGIWAPIFLISLRVIQGLSFGGELAGAMLMAVEHAPPSRKALFGSLPQMGPSVGLLLSTGAFALVSKLPEDSFMSWGWRLPFVASALLVGVGLFIRLRVQESPEFVHVKRERKTSTLPALDVLVKHKKTILLTIGGKLAEVTFYFTLVVFAISYAISTLHFDKADVLYAVMIGAAIQTMSIPFFGWLGDKIGSKRVYVGGCFLLMVMAVPVFTMMGSGSLLAFELAIVIGLALSYASIFGPQSEFYSAQFPAELRYTGMSLGIQIAAAIGGGLAPIVATLLVSTYGSIVSVGFYIAGLACVSGLCALALVPPTKSVWKA